MNLEHVDFLAYKQFDKARNSHTSDKKVHLDNIPKISKKPARKLISDFMEFSQKSKSIISTNKNSIMEFFDQIFTKIIFQKLIIIILKTLKMNIFEPKFNMTEFP